MLGNSVYRLVGDYPSEAYQLLCQGERCLRDGKGLGAEQELARVD